MLTAALENNAACITLRGPIITSYQDIPALALPASSDSQVLGLNSGYSAVSSLLSTCVTRNLLEFNGTWIGVNIKGKFLAETCWIRPRVTDFLFTRGFGSLSRCSCKDGEIDGQQKLCRA